MICPHDFCWFLSLVSKWEHTHVQDSKLIKCSSQNLMLNRSITCQRLAKIIFNKLIILRNVLQPEVSILLQSAVFSSICSHSLQYLAWSRVNIESPFCFLRTITDRIFAPEQATWSTAGVLLGFLLPQALPLLKGQTAAQLHPAHWCSTTQSSPFAPFQWCKNWQNSVLQWSW